MEGMRVISALRLKKLRETVTFALESQVGAKVLEAGSLALILEPLLKDMPVDLVICEYPDSAAQLLKFLVAMDKNVPVLIVVPESASEKDRADSLKLAAESRVLAVLQGSDIVEEALKWARLVQSRKPAAGIAPTPGAGAGTTPGEGAPPESHPTESHPEDDFCRIKVNLLRGMNPMGTDIYIRLGPSKFLKLFQKGDSFDALDRQKYLLEKKVEFLYVKKGESALVLSFLQKGLAALLESGLEDPLQIEQMSIAVHEAASEVIAKLGITPEVREVIKTNIMVTVKTMGANPRLKNVLARLTADKNKYISSHSVLLSQLTCSIAGAMEWGSESTFLKLTMASFFHDITLTDHRAAQMQTREDIQAHSKTYSKEAIREYLLHAAKAAEMTHDFGEVPPDVDTIIAQHHEKPDGTGFPRGLNHKNIIPLSCVFIVAHDLLSWMLKKGERFDIAEFIEARKELYAAGNFRKVLARLENIEI
jgi:hypothetical protein